MPHEMVMREKEENMAIGKLGRTIKIHSAQSAQYNGHDRKEKIQQELKGKRESYCINSRLILSEFDFLRRQKTGHFFLFFPSQRRMQRMRF